MVRVKKRYFVLQIQSERDVEAAAWGRPIPSSGSLKALGRDGTLGNAIKDLVTELHGDFGRAAVTVGLRSIYANADTGLCLVQARHGPHRLVASALPFLVKINDDKVVPRVIYTGATVRNCYKVSLLRKVPKLMKLVKCLWFTNFRLWNASKQSNCSRRYKSSKNLHRWRTRRRGGC